MCNFFNAAAETLYPTSVDFRRKNEPSLNHQLDGRVLFSESWLLSRGHIA